MGLKTGVGKIGKKYIDNICPPREPLGPLESSSKKSIKSLFWKERKSEGKRGVGGGRGNVVNPIGFSIISMAGARGERGR